MQQSDPLTNSQYIAEQLHLLFCKKTHEYDMRQLLNAESSDKCFWYLECQIHPTWEQAAHKKYLDVVEAITPTIKEMLYEGLKEIEISPDDYRVE